MKSFKFQFETLLKTKQIYVDEALFEHEKAKDALNLLEDKKKLLTLEVNDLKEKIYQIQCSPSSLHELEESQIYFTSLQEQLIKLDDEIMLAQNVCSQKKAILANALKEKKIIEKLKEKQYTEWNEKVKMLEGKQIDEAAMNQFLRKSKASQNE